MNCLIFTTGDFVSIGSRVKIARDLRGFNQSELAKRSGISQPAISFIERGESQNTIHIVKIADALNVSVDWLSKGIGAMDKSRPVERRGAGYLVELSAEELDFIVKLREADAIRRSLALAALSTSKAGKNNISNSIASNGD